MSDLAYRKWNPNAYHTNSKGNLVIDRKAYRMLREKKIKSKKVGREYKIPKVNVIKYIMTEQ